MTLKTNANRQSNVAISCGEQLIPGHARLVVPRLRRPAHLPGDFLAGAILVPFSADVNGNLKTSADDFDGVTPFVNAAVVVLASGAGVTAKSTYSLSEIGIAAALDDDDEDEDEDEDDDDYDDLDEEDDEDLDDEDDAEFDDEDDLDDPDDDLDDDDIDDEDDDEE